MGEMAGMSTPMRGSRRRGVALAGVASLVLSGILTATAGSASAAEDGLSLTPDRAAAGAVVRVSGAGFAGECDVVLRWGDELGEPLGTAKVGSDGGFSAQFRVPGQAARGATEIVAQGRAHGLPGQGCAAPSGTTASGGLTVTSAPEPRGRTIALQSRAVSAAGLDQATIARARTSTTGVHAIVQLHALPAEGDLADLADLGVRPLAYLNAKNGPGTAYLATVAPTVRSTDKRFSELVRALHPILPQDKVEASLAARTVASQRAIDADVLFFEDVTAAAATAALGGVGVSSAAALGDNLFQATLTRSQLQRLAQVDAVQFIAESAPPDQLDLDNSRALINVDAVQGFVADGIYTGLTGAGVQVSIHDSGVDLEHRDFENRWLASTLDASGSDHGTHVASIAVGSGAMSDQDNDGGVNNMGTPFQWRGMAPQAGIAAFGSQTAHNAGTMQTAIVTNGVDVSNHSYSYNDGQYDGNMVSIDGLIRGDNAAVPARPMIFSAGNQGSAPQYGENSGYFSLSKSCKNCVIVANMAGANTLRQGSSHGPTPDGRVKPEVGALGTGVIAAGADIDEDGNPATGNSYRVKGGTSMSTPAVTGVVALMLQQFAKQGVNLTTDAPLPSTSRAILIQTAIDQVGTSDGTNPDTGAATRFGPGPDWATGWGLVDAKAAVDFVAAGDFVEDAVSPAGHTDEHYVQVVPGQAELKVTLAWDDRPGTPNANHATPQLVNDLDLYLLGPNGEFVRPLVLPAATQFDCDAGTDGTQTGCADPGSDPGPWPSSGTPINAAPGIDRLNNVEQAVLANPAPGLWKAFVSVRNPDTSVRLPLGGTQAYALAGVSDDRADLSVTKTTSPDPVVLAGNELIYTVRVRNDGPDAAKGVVVTDVLPAEVVYVANDAGCGFTVATRTLTCELGDIASGAQKTFQIKTVVKPDTVVGTADGHRNIINTVTVSSQTPDLNATNDTFTKTTFVQEAADLRVTKLCQPLDHQPAGRSAVCTIFVDNLGPSYARNARLVDTHTSDGAFTLGPITTTAGACAIASGTVTCNFGNLANASPTTSGRVTVTVGITATEDIDVQNLATATSATPDPVPANNTAVAGVQFLASSDLALTKTGPATAIAGTDITYSLTVTNNGPSTATGVTISDLLPQQVTMIGVTCSGGGTANPGQPGNPLAPATCSFGNLATGASRTMTVEVSVKPEALGPIHNNARADATVLDPNLANNLATVTTTVSASADLSITKTDSPDPVIAGNPLSYVLTVRNDGPSTAVAVKVEDLIPAGTTFVSGQDGNGATVCTLVEPGKVVCELGTLAPGATVTVYLKVTVAPSVDPGASLVNTATVSSPTPDPAPGNNEATATTAVITSAEVWLDKQATLRSGNPSNVVTYTLVVHNDSGCETDAQSTETPTCGSGGPSDARGITVVDKLPLDAKKLVVQYLSPQCTYAKGSHTVTCTAAVVPAGASVTFVVEAQVSGSVGTIANTAQLTTTTTDPVLGNNTDTATIVHQGGTGGTGGGGGGKGGGKKP